MIREVFYEQIIIRPESKWDIYIKALKPLAYLLLLISMLKRLPIFIIITLTLSIFAYILPLYFFIDYEYELTNNELQISKVKNNKKREVIARLNARRLLGINEHTGDPNETLIKVAYDHQNITTVIFETEIGKVGFNMNLDEKMKRLLLSIKEEEKEA